MVPFVVSLRKGVPVPSNVFRVHKSRKANTFFCRAKVFERIQKNDGTLFIAHHKRRAIVLGDQRSRSLTWSLNEVRSIHASNNFQTFLGVLQTVPVSNESIARL